MSQAVEDALLGVDKLDADDIAQVLWRRRVVAAKKRFDDLPHGSQGAAAKALGIATTTVSSVLQGRIVDSKTLTRLEQWLDMQEPKPRVLRTASK